MAEACVVRAGKTELETIENEEPEGVSCRFYSLFSTGSDQLTSVYQNKQTE